MHISGCSAIAHFLHIAKILALWTIRISHIQLDYGQPIASTYQTFRCSLMQSLNSCYVLKAIDVHIYVYTYIRTYVVCMYVRTYLPCMYVYVCINLLIEEHSLKIDRLKCDVDTMLGIGDQKLKLSMTLNNVIQAYGEPKILAEHVDPIGYVGPL